MASSDADRRLRVQYPGAMYHITSRGVQRSDVFLNDEDRQHFFAGCETTVNRFGWQVFAAAQMTNHFHLLVKTPEPNLCRGTQLLLGPYARQFNRRHRRSGHLFEGRYRCHVIENETYLWTVSKYIHLNPVPALVAHPDAWSWSSYRGYRDPQQRLPWVCYEELLAAWKGACGGDALSFCQFTESGLVGERPGFPELIDGWIIGSERFAQRIRSLVSPESNEPAVRRARKRPIYRLDQVLLAVAEECNVTDEQLSMKSKRHPARRLFASLAHRLTPATLDEIASTLGLAGRDSVHKLTDASVIQKSAELSEQAARIQSRLKNSGCM